MIFNMSAGDNTSEEVTVLLTEFMNEVNNTLTAFKSEVNTMLTGFTNEVDADITALSNSVSSVKTDVGTVKSNVGTLTTSLSTLSSTVNSIPKGAVKSVQRGVHGGSATDNITITINTVNPSKCMVLLQRTRDTTNLPSLVSIASTSFTVTTSSAVYSTSPNTASPFSWQVIEFY
jgi:uncharacterized protein YoxC